MSRQDFLLAFVRSHGCTPIVEADGAVKFTIPWVNVNDGSEGFDTFTVHSIAEARNALGY